MPRIRCPSASARITLNRPSSFSCLFSALPPARPLSTTHRRWCRRRVRAVEVRVPRMLRRRAEELPGGFAGLRAELGLRQGPGVVRPHPVERHQVLDGRIDPLLAEPLQERGKFFAQLAGQTAGIANRSCDLRVALVEIHPLPERLFFLHGKTYLSGAARTSER